MERFPIKPSFIFLSNVFQIAFGYQKNIKELNADFIDGQSPMTKLEELAMSEFIQNGKEKHRQQVIPKKKAVKK